MHRLVLGQFLCNAHFPCYTETSFLWDAIIVVVSFNLILNVHQTRCSFLVKQEMLNCLIVQKYMHQQRGKKNVTWRKFLSLIFGMGSTLAYQRQRLNSSNISLDYQVFQLKQTPLKYQIKVVVPLFFVVSTFQ